MIIRKPLASVVSNHCSFHLFIHLVMCIHPNSRTLGSCRSQPHCLVPCFGWMGTVSWDTVWALSPRGTAQPHSQQGLSASEGAFGSAPLVRALHHPAPSGGRQPLSLSLAPTSVTNLLLETPL